YRPVTPGVAGSSPVRTAESQDVTLTKADKARNIQSITCFFITLQKTTEATKMPQKDKVQLQIRYRKNVREKL
ncbi:MAG: hypothetical protein OSJ36_11200, partial [Odoribacter sp.]|nr:hypothetical protein [Odoribacter sp.]